MGGDIEPRRLALRYAPAAIIVEYARKQSYRTQLYHHEIDVQRLLPMAKTSSLSEWAAADIVEQILEEHGSVLDGVSSQQLKRLVKRLASPEAEKAATTDKDRTSSVREPAPAAVPLPQADYNRVSETQLQQVKDKMNVVFEKNIVRPGDKGYQYDKQISFTPSEEASDWDD